MSYLYKEFQIQQRLTHLKKISTFMGLLIFLISEVIKIHDLDNFVLFICSVRDFNRSCTYIGNLKLYMDFSQDSSFQHVVQNKF